jgi:hypothetical protein
MAAKAAREKVAAKPKKLSSLDAAAKVLEDNGSAMNCQEMMRRWPRRGSGPAPAAKTPHGGNDWSKRFAIH